jgi:radical SAM-linked protein
MTETYTQRMRVTFSTADTVKYVGHLDMHRAWERAIRRARLPLAYTQGFNPQARLQFAAALPVGFTGQAEVADVYLNEALAPAEFLCRLAAALPPGIRPLRAEPVARELPSLQSQVCGAAYRVAVETDEPDAVFAARLAGFLARPEAWRERRKGKDVVRYDLRPLVQGLAYAGPNAHGQTFTAVMRAKPGATGRPDELLAELGFESASRRIERQALLFAG